MGITLEEAKSKFREEFPSYKDKSIPNDIVTDYYGDEVGKPKTGKQKRKAFEDSNPDYVGADNSTVDVWWDKKNQPKPSNNNIPDQVNIDTSGMNQQGQGQKKKTTEEIIAEAFAKAGLNPDGTPIASESPGVGGSLGGVSSSISSLGGGSDFASQFDSMLGGMGSDYGLSWSESTPMSDFETPSQPSSSSLGSFDVESPNSINPTQMFEQYSKNLPKIKKDLFTSEDVEQVAKNPRKSVNQMAREYADQQTFGNNYTGQFLTNIMRMLGNLG